MGTNDELLHREFCTVNMVLKGMQSAPLGKAPGIDGIPGELIRYGGYELAKGLQLLFNIVAKFGIPKEWKQAIIIPIYKKDDPADVANYRPIALTCTMRRIYERIILIELEEYIERLEDSQGGFRKHRSTLHQVMCLHEICVANPKATHVFLDLKAAYDLVPRNILWRILLNHFQLPADLVRRLQNLFDHNQSIVRIRNQESLPIHNQRGLLQGSSLSPVLFNFFINDLLLRLNNGPKISTNRVLTNNLFFADDGALHAKSIQDMRFLLEICETWARENQMIFSIPKCAFIHSVPTHLLFEGSPIPQVDSFRYLGIHIKQSGIDFDATMFERTQKTQRVIGMLSSLGFNLTGWAPLANRRIYKSFIRPVMEYGLALRPLDKQEILGYEKVQLAALRRATNAPRNSPSRALLKLFQIEEMSQRNLYLNAKLYLTLHNTRDSSCLAIRMFWNHHVPLARNGRATDKSVITATRHNNELWRTSAKISHLTERLERGAAFSTFGHADVQKKYRELHRERLENNTGNVARNIIVYSKKFESYMQPIPGMSRKTRVSILRWRAGMVCFHQECLCGTDLSRDHGLECSGALVYLQRAFPHENHNFTRGNEENPGIEHQPHRFSSLLDFILDKNKFSSDISTLDKLAHAIGLIMTRCRGLVQSKTGNWREPLTADPVLRCRIHNVTINNIADEQLAARRHLLALDRAQRRRQQRGIG